MSEPEPCIGNMTYGIRANANDLIGIWRNKPWRRDEFGKKEAEELEQAAKQLVGLAQHILIHLNRKKLKGVA
jgi:hypothetical protein